MWALDGTLFEQLVAPLGRRALIVVELHGKKTLCMQSVPGERARAATAVLERLIEQHGAPLVLKVDNGSAFIARCFSDCCDRHGITLMYSPVGQPSWNGTCEVSCRWGKARAVAAAHRRGATDELTQADLDAAVTCTGPLPRIDDALRSHFRAVVAEQLAVVCHERGLVLDAHTAHHVRRSLGRVAARRALQLCHILSIEGRAFPQCLPASAA